MSEEKNKTRINKYLAQAGLCSRREADQMVQAGMVLVNGVKASNGTMVGEKDRVEVRGKSIRRQEEKLLIAFYKPVGVVCTEKDRFADKKILDYVRTKVRVTYAGRLDKDSEGLILLTNDGQLIQSLMKGANRHEKEYVVKVSREIQDDFLKRMEAGIYLEELNQTTRPCLIEKKGRYTFHIILTQGLNRQIRRMCDVCGYRVESLKRIRVMNIGIGTLKPGESRVIDGEERKTLYRLVGLSED